MVWNRTQIGRYRLRKKFLYFRALMSGVTVLLCFFFSKWNSSNGGFCCHEGSSEKCWRRSCESQSCLPNWSHCWPFSADWFQQMVTPCFFWGNTRFCLMLNCGFTLVFVLSHPIKSLVVSGSLKVDLMVAERGPDKSSKNNTSEGEREWFWGVIDGADRI